MRWLAGFEPRYSPARVAALGNAMRLYAGMGLFAVMCLLISPVMIGLGLLMPISLRGRFARGMITWVFRTYFRVMSRAGAMRLDLSALELLRDAPAMVIAPNHPSMIDAALVLSCVPNLTCVMKPSVLDNILFGSAARMASYITSDPPRHMLRAAGESLRSGRHLLLFPEGTRTQALPVNRFQRTVGVIARRAGVPVQTLIIEAGTAFLARNWPLLPVPLMPMVYRVRLGRRFEPPADVDAFSAELETYFHDELAGARLPSLPVNASSR